MFRLMPASTKERRACCFSNREQPNAKDSSSIRRSPSSFNFVAMFDRVRDQLKNLCMSMDKYVSRYHSSSYSGIPKDKGGYLAKKLAHVTF